MQEQEKEQKTRFMPPEEEELSTLETPGPREGEQEQVPQPEPPEDPDRQLNFQIPWAVARISWPNDPATAETYVTIAEELTRECNSDLLEQHQQGG